MEEWINLFLKQLIVAIAGGVSTYLGVRLREKKAELKAKEEDDKLRREVDRAILRNTIRQACKKRIAKGWVELDEKGDIWDCYVAYEKIIQRDGLTNGVIDDCIKKYRALPNTPPKEAQHEN